MNKIVFVALSVFAFCTLSFAQEGKTFPKQELAPYSISKTVHSTKNNVLPELKAQSISNLTTDSTTYLKIQPRIASFAIANPTK